MKTSHHQDTSFNLLLVKFNNFAPESQDISENNQLVIKGGPKVTSPF